MRAVVGRFPAVDALLQVRRRISEGVGTGLNMTAYEGQVTWYDLCDEINNPGAGGDYDCPCDNGSYHVAYAPIPTTNCNTAHGYGCNGYLPNHDFCDLIAVQSPCTDLFVWLSIRDCPCFNLPPDHSGDCQYTCWMQSNDCEASYGHTLADLTETAFMALGYNPSLTGRIWVTLYA